MEGIMSTAVDGDTTKVTAMHLEDMATVKATVTIMAEATATNRGSRRPTVDLRYAYT
jgi:hypothetical protein